MLKIMVYFISLIYRFSNNSLTLNSVKFVFALSKKLIILRQFRKLTKNIYLIVNVFYIFFKYETKVFGRKVIMTTSLEYTLKEYNFFFKL